MNQKRFQSQGNDSKLEIVDLKQIIMQIKDNELQVSANGVRLMDIPIVSFEELMKGLKKVTPTMVIDIGQFQGTLRQGRIEKLPNDFPIAAILDYITTDFLVFWTHCYVNDFKLENFKK